MNHEMRLLPEPFDLIKSGRKTVEIRLNDEKRQILKVGDTITFSKMDPESEILTIEVLELLHFNTFRDLYESRPLEEFGFADASIERMLEETYRIYTPERERKYGALGIRVRIADKF